MSTTHMTYFSIKNQWLLICLLGIFQSRLSHNYVGCYTIQEKRCSNYPDLFVLFIQFTITKRSQESIHNKEYQRSKFQLLSRNLFDIEKANVEKLSFFHGVSTKKMGGYHFLHSFPSPSLGVRKRCMVSICRAWSVGTWISCFLVIVVMDYVEVKIMFL